MDILPLHDQFGAIIQVADLGVVVLGSVEVGHERGDILGGGEPGVDVVPSVEEAPGGDGDVLHLVPVERELEAEVDGGGPAVALRQHVVLLHSASVRPRLVELVQVVEMVLALPHCVAVVFVGLLQQQFISESTDPSSILTLSNVKFPW